MDNQTIINAAQLQLEGRPIIESVKILTVYTTGSTIDANAVAGQKVVPVTATTNFTAGDRVILGRGTDRKEERIIDSVDPGVSITVLTTNLTYNHTISAEQTLDAESALGQKKVYVTLTAGLLAGETVVIDTGNAGEETGVIASVTTNDYITLVSNLTKTHAIGVKVNHTGLAGIVEVCMASLSEIVSKPYHKNMAIFLPSDWTTAIISLTGCDTLDGTFNKIVDSVAAAEVVTASVAASLVVSFSGANRDAIAAVPYIQLRSGTLVAPVDQGAGNITIKYVLTR